MSRTVKHDSTDQSVTIRIIDSSDGTPETGVTSATAGLALWYRREGAGKTSITVTDLTNLTDAHSDGGILHISDGYYRLDIPDAAFASGADEVVIGGTATGMIVLGVTVPLVAYDPEDAVRLGLTALPNANAGTTSGIPLAADIADAVMLEQIGDHTGVSGSVAAHLNNILNNATSAADSSTVLLLRVPDTISLANISSEIDTALADFWTSPATLVDLIWDELSSEHTVSGSFGAYLDDQVSNSVTAPNMMVNTTIATVTDQQNITLTDGPPDDDALNGHMILFIDSTNSSQVSGVRVEDYVGSTKAVTLETAPTFTIAVGDTAKAFLSPNRIALVDVVTTNSDMITTADINAEVDTALSDYGTARLTEVQTELALLNDVSPAEVRTEVAGALSDIHLDHLLASSYNPAAKPGAADALLNELIVSDGGVSQFSINALENAPTGSGGGGSETLVLHSGTITAVNSQQSLVLSSGAPDNDAYNGLVLLLTDQTTGEQKSVAHIVDYDGPALTVTLEADPIFTIAVGDSFAVLAIPYATVSTIKAQVDQALIEYDGPTDAEMESAFAALNDLSVQDVENAIASSGATAAKQDQMLADIATVDGKIGNATYGLSALKTLIDTVYTVVDAIKAVTDNLPDSGALSDLAAIVADTNELQTDWTDGGRLDLLIDAIKAVTDNLPNSGALSDLATLESRLTAARAGYLDNLNVGGLVATQNSTSVGGRLLSTTIASVTSQTEFVLTTGFTNDDMPNNVSYCIITDSSDSNQKAVGYPSDYTATSKTLTLKADPGIFTVAAGDSIEIYAMPNINDVTTAYNNIISVANTPVGQTSGFPTEIITGDAYTVANGRQIKMYFYDSAGNVMTSFGTKSPSDTDFTWAFRMVPATDPDITPVTMEVTGDVNDWDTTDPNNPYLVVELPAASTDLLTVDADQLTKEYYWQLVLQWGGGSVYELTAVTNGTVTVRRKYE